MDESLVGLVKNIVTNDVVFNVAERNVAYRHYCSKLKEVGGESEDVEQGVDAMYDRREDPVGAVAIDQMLVHLRPGYSNSLGRIECARSILANEQSTNASKHYFSNVTNTLDGFLK